MTKPGKVTLSRKAVENIFAVEGIKITADDWAFLDSIAHLDDEARRQAILLRVKSQSKEPT